MVVRKRDTDKPGRAENQPSYAISEERLKRFKKAFEARWLKERYRKTH